MEGGCLGAVGGLAGGGGGALGWFFWGAVGLVVDVGRRFWGRLGIVAGRARRSAQAGSIAPPALAVALRVRRVERHAARRGDLRLDPRGNGLPDRRLLLAAQLDSGNPPLLRDPLDAELARQRPIAAAPTPAVAELEPRIESTQRLVCRGRCERYVGDDSPGWLVGTENGCKPVSNQRVLADQTEQLSVCDHPQHILTRCR